MENKMEYPKTLRFTSPYRKYKIFLESPTKREIDGQLVRTQGHVLEFDNWECACDDPKTIRLALESGLYGKDYIAPDWEKAKMTALSKPVDVQKAGEEKPKKGRPKK